MRSLVCANTYTRCDGEAAGWWLWPWQ